MKADYLSRILKKINVKKTFYNDVISCETMNDDDRKRYGEAYDATVVIEAEVRKRVSMDIEQSEKIDPRDLEDFRVIRDQMEAIWSTRQPCGAYRNMVQVAMNALATANNYASKKLKEQREIEELIKEEV